MFISSDQTTPQPEEQNEKAKSKLSLVRLRAALEAIRASDYRTDVIVHSYPKAEDDNLPSGKSR